MKIDLYKYWQPEIDQLSDRGHGENFIEHISYLKESLPFLAEAENVVDLGCGCGTLVKYFQDQGKQAAGITYQKEEVAVAQSRGIPNIFLGDLHDLPFEDNMFDGAVCWDVIEHTVAPLIALHEMNRVLKPGGKGLIFVPGQKWTTCKYHIIVPTIPQMCHLLTLAGFETNLRYLGYIDIEMAVYHVVKK